MIMQCPWREIAHALRQDTRDICISPSGTEYGVTGRLYELPRKPFFFKADSTGQEYVYEEYGPWSGYDTAWCLTATSDGGYVLGGKMERSSTMDNILVYKVDTNGNEVWHQEHDIAGYFDRMWDVMELDDGRLVGCGTVSPTSSEKHDAGLIMMNALGELQWYQAYGPAGSTEVAKTFAQTSDGGFIIGGYYGWSNSSLDITNQLFVIKTDALGNEQWSRTFGSPTVWNCAHWVAETGDGGFLVAGQTGDLSGGTDGWLMKLSADGTLVWDRLIGGSNNDWFRDGILLNDGTSVLVGLTQSYSTDPGGDEQNRDGWVLRVDADGNSMWEDVFGQPGSHDQFAAINGPDAGGHYLVGGFIDYDIYIIKFDFLQENSGVHNLDTSERFTGIQEAIDDADTLDGHTLIAYSGTYLENVTIHKRLTITGEDKDSTIIDGGSVGDVVSITADNVQLSGFTIQDCEMSFGPLYAGVKVQSNNCVVDGNNIKDCHNGVYLYPGTTGSVVSNNTVTNDVWCWTGILVYQSSGNRLYGNTLTNSLGHGTGVFLEQSSGNNVFANTIHDNVTGIYLINHADDNLIHHNNFINNINHNAHIETALGPCTGNQWSMPYSMGGNYWSDHAGPDLYKGGGQNIPGSDGYIDVPYAIYGGWGDQDLLPRVDPFVPQCGNVNGSADGSIDISDLTYLVSYMFHTPSGPAPIPPCSADVNGDGGLDISDLNYLVDYMFRGGPPPVENCCS